MTAFVTVDEYATMTNTVVVPSSTAEAQIEALLDAACEEIRHITGQTIDLVEDDTVLLDGPGSVRLLLPQLPIVAVDDVTINVGLSSEQSVSDWITRDNGVLYRKLGWPYGIALVEVTYDHGWPQADIPADLKNVAIQATRAGIAVSPGGIVSESIGGYSYSRGEVKAGVQEFKDTLSRYVLHWMPVA